MKYEGCLMPVWSETWLKLVHYLKCFGKKFVWISQSSSYIDKDNKNLTERFDKLLTSTQT